MPCWLARARLFVAPEASSKIHDLIPTVNFEQGSYVSQGLQPHTAIMPNFTFADDNRDPKVSLNADEHRFYIETSTCFGFARRLACCD